MESVLADEDSSLLKISYENWKALKEKMSEKKVNKDF